MPLFAIIFLTGAVFLCVSLSVFVIRLGEKPVKTSLIFVLVSIIITLAGVGLGHDKIFGAKSAAVSPQAAAKTEKKAALSDEEIKKIINSGESIALNICNMGFKAQADGQPKVDFSSLSPILEGYYSLDFINKHYRDFYQNNLSDYGFEMLVVFPLADAVQVEASFAGSRQIDAKTIQAQFLMPALTDGWESPASIETYVLTKNKDKWVISDVQSKSVSAQPDNAQEPSVSGNNLQQAEQYYKLGKECADQYYYNKAIEYYNKAISLNPTNAEYYHDAALTLNLLGNLTGSNTFCDKAIQIDPRYNKCYLLKAMNLNKLKAYDQAITAANMVFQNGGSAEDQALAVLEIAGCYNAAGQYSDTINLCNQKMGSIKHASIMTRTAVYVRLIQAYDAVGNYYQALEEAKNTDNLTGDTTYYQTYREFYRAKGIML